MTYPICTHLDGIWFSIRTFTERLVPGSTPNSVTILDDRKVVDRCVGQRLLLFISTHSHIVQSHSIPGKCRRITK